MKEAFSPGALEWSYESLGTRRGGGLKRTTDVEVLVLRQPQVQYISDSTQEASIVRIYTDAGVTGVGDTDSAPPAVKACIEMPSSHHFCRGLREILIGEDPLDIEACWDKMYRFSLWYGRRGGAGRSTRDDSLCIRQSGRHRVQPGEGEWAGRYDGAHPVGREAYSEYPAVLVPLICGRLPFQIQREVGSLVVRQLATILEGL